MSPTLALPISLSWQSLSARKPRFSCNLQVHVSLSEREGWTTQKGCRWQNESSEIWLVFSAKNLLFTFFIVSKKSHYLHFILFFVIVCITLLLLTFLQLAHLKCIIVSVVKLFAGVINQIFILTVGLVFLWKAKNFLRPTLQLVFFDYLTDNNLFFSFLFASILVLLRNVTN